MSAAPSSLTLAEKTRLFQEEKYMIFQELSKDKSLIFSYFIENNPYFKLISNEDMNQFSQVTLAVVNERSTVFMGSIGAVLAIDLLVLPFAFPKLRILPKNHFSKIIKYLFLPIGISVAHAQFFLQNYEEKLNRLVNKYNFGFEDYMNANKIFERALAADKLDQLMKQGDKFDWTGIPELTELTK